MKFIAKNNRLPLLTLTLSILILVLHHMFFYFGHYGYDDMLYAKIAKNLIDCNIDFNDHFTFRFTIILLTSLSYLVFGVSDFASALPSLIIGSSILILVFVVLHKKSLSTLVIGLSLTTFSNALLFYTDKLMPDIYVAFAFLAALTSIYSHKYKRKKTSPFLYSFLTALSLLFGFISKGTIVLIIPLLLFLFIIDFRQKRDLKFWLYLMFNGVLLLCLYFFVTWSITGEFAKRFSAITQNGYINPCSYNKQEVSVLIHRITYGLFERLMRNGILFNFLFVLSYLIHKKPSTWLKFDTKKDFFALSTLLLVLSSNFMSISLTSYNPMCLDQRHYLFLIPISAISAALILRDIIESKKGLVQLLIVLTATVIIGYITKSDRLNIVTIPILALLSIFFFVKSNTITKRTFTTLLIAIIAFQPYYSIKSAFDVNYPKQRKIIIDEVLKKHPNSYIITNHVQRNIGNYYTWFNQKYNNITFLDYKEFETNKALTDSIPRFLLLNQHTRNYSNTRHKELPEYARLLNNKNPLLFSEDELGIEFYELNDTAVAFKKELLLHSINNFEKEVPYWTQHNNMIVSKPVFEGTKAYKLPEFSTTLKYPLDSLKIAGAKKIQINYSTHVYFYRRTQAQLVLSIENESGSYHYKNVYINPYIKTYTNWWLVANSIYLDVEDIKPNSELRIYVWSQEFGKGYIDDFEVTVFKLW